MKRIALGRGLCREGAPTIDRRQRWIHMDYEHERYNLIHARKAGVLHAFVQISLIRDSVKIKLSCRFNLRGSVLDELWDSHHL